jgi:vancomycin resistance protein YoaR
MSMANHDFFSSLIKKALLAIALGVSGFLIFSTFFVVGVEVLFAGRIFPGVEVNGVDIGGLSIPDALNKLNSLITYPQTAKIELLYQGNAWEYTPLQLGINLDPATTLRNAYQVARSGPIDRWVGDLLTTWNSKHILPPVFIFNQEVAAQTLKLIANHIEQPTREASLEVQGISIISKPGQVGITLDIPATLVRIFEKVQTQQEGNLPLVVKEYPPELLDASQYADSAREILNYPLILTVPVSQASSQGSWTFTPEVLANMLQFERIKNGGVTGYNVKLNEEVLRKFLNDLALRINTLPENPRFSFNENSHQLELLKSGSIGQTLDVEKSIAIIQENVKKGKHEISLIFTFTPPILKDNVSAEQLGISELIQSESSYFFGSIPARLQNIQVAANRFNGVLVAPGETFSMAKTMGEISLNTGYSEALIIYNGQTIEGVGGGVCQVSTTLFRTAFLSGFPINERHPHAYRVKYYEKTAGNSVNPDLAGLDATVYVPMVDLKFTNDTPHWLLMETDVSPKKSSITWKFYSTSDSRYIKWDTSGPTNLVDPPLPLYRENPDLKSGEIKQVDWEAQGADVSVNRTVYKNNSVYFQDSIITHYEPWRAIYEYGPGTQNIPQQQTP